MNTVVRCKFRCHMKEPVSAEYGGGASIYLSPVYTGSDENERYFKATPWGEFRIGIVNEQAAKQFDVNREYYIDIISAESIQNNVVEVREVIEAAQAVRAILKTTGDYSEYTRRLADAVDAYDKLQGANK